MCIQLENQTVYQWLSTQKEIVGFWRDQLIGAGAGLSTHLDDKQQADEELIHSLETHYHWLASELVRLSIRHHGKSLDTHLV